MCLQEKLSSVLAIEMDLENGMLVSHDFIIKFSNVKQKLKEFYIEHLYTCHLVSMTNILLYLLHCVSVVGTAILLSIMLLCF